MNESHEGLRTPGQEFTTNAPNAVLVDQQQNVARHITINELNKGYLVSVGCHRFAIETKERLVSLLSEYLASPSATEGKFRDGKLF